MQVKHIWAILLVLAHAAMAGPTINSRLPRLEAGALDGSRLVLPDSAEGSVTLVGIGYRRESQDDLSSWLFPFRSQFESAGGFRAYEIPMMGPRIPGLLRGVINRAMRNAIAEPNRRWVAPFYGNIDEYSKRLGVTDRSRVQMFLLDGSGIIRWHAAGPADSTLLAGLIRTAAELAVRGGE
ncbi:hypothetical protein JXD38_07545 [candidate division WOR-3 bacterium]|nr:hypothetical protein [candidate division WOR-3 bacterium]